MRPSERVFAGGPARRRTVISLTPLIDVVFILLVFFMLATSFDRFRRLPLAGAGEVAPARISVSRAIVTEAGLIVDGRALTLDEAVAMLAERAAASDMPRLVVVATDETAGLQTFVTAIEALRAGEVGSVAATRP